MNPANRSMHVNVLPVGSRENYRRAVPKTYSYRYEIAADAGPDGNPLIRAGAVIIESRYRGRFATWNVRRSVVEPATFQACGGYVHPLEEHPMAYPPRSVEGPAATRAPAPGFAESVAAKLVRREAGRIDATRSDANATAAAKASPRPTPANESAAYRKNG